MPPGYQGKADTRYPVLYLLDGGEKENFPHLANALDGLIKENAIPPMLLVGIENTERPRDLTGPTTVESDRETAPVVGESAVFREFIQKELKPQIALFYKVDNQSAIIGESLAGLFVIETLFVKPDLFDTYIALDPSVSWNAEQWWREAGKRLDGSTDIRAQLLLLSAGDSGTSTAHLAEALCQYPLPDLHWSYALHPDLRHDNIFASLEKEVIRQAFSGQALPTPDCKARN